MKTNTLLLLLLLASLAVLATGASAAQNENEVVVLPTYNVTAPRYTPVERQINASLDEVRQIARTPVAVSTECPALKATLSQATMVALQSEAEKTVHLAKL